MLEEVTTEGGFPSREECARSILCAVLHDDAAAHELKTNVVAVDFANAAQSRKK